MARGFIRHPSGYVSAGRSAADKAYKFAMYTQEHGWAGKWSTNEKTGITHLFARRGENETIDIWWLANGSLDLDHLPVYTLAGERIKLRNVSAAAAIARNLPNPDRLKKNVRRRRNTNGTVTPTDASELLASVQGSLPFDHESTDAELKAVLFGRTITWLSPTAGLLNSAVVGGKNVFKVVRKATCPTYIDFVDDTGFHSVHLDKIVSVG